MENKITMKIEDVITQRLKMQSTQKNLENEFGIKDFSKNTIINYITNNLGKLQEPRKKKLIDILGGRANFKKTQSFIESL